MAGEDITSLRLRIEGFVQGDGYRAFAAAEARRLGLNGWVRNRSGGTVEALASGTTKDVEAFVAACMRGPAGAHVENVELHNAEAPAELGFRQRPTL
jgi:acylphosphatase